jgi:ATP-dependent Clp protease ATP-binding subunit ClpA
VFTRFSPAAKRALRLAEQECRNLNHYYVAVEHLMLALCEESDPAVTAALAERGIGCDALQSALRKALGTGEDRMWDGILVTPRVRTVVELAEGLTGASAPVEPVHLLEAILAEGRSTAAGLMAPVPQPVRCRAG